jgi:hypothetical protein
VYVANQSPLNAKPSSVLFKLEKQKSSATRLNCQRRTSSVNTFNLSYRHQKKSWHRFTVSHSASSCSAQPSVKVKARCFRSPGMCSHLQKCFSKRWILRKNPRIPRKKTGSSGSNRASSKRDRLTRSFTRLIIYRIQRNWFTESPWKMKLLNSAWSRYRTTRRWTFRSHFTCSAVVAAEVSPKSWS